MKDKFDSERERKRASITVNVVFSGMCLSFYFFANSPILYILFFSLFDLTFSWSFNFLLFYLSSLGLLSHCPIFFAGDTNWIFPVGREDYKCFEDSTCCLNFVATWSDITSSLVCQEKYYFWLKSPCYYVPAVSTSWLLSAAYSVFCLSFDTMFRFGLKLSLDILDLNTSVHNCLVQGGDCVQ